MEIAKAASAPRLVIGAWVLPFTSMGLLRQAANVANGKEVPRSQSVKMSGFVFANYSTHKGENKCRAKLYFRPQPPGRNRMMYPDIWLDVAPHIHHPVNLHGNQCAGNHVFTAFPEGPPRPLLPLISTPLDNHRKNRADARRTTPPDSPNSPLRRESWKINSGQSCCLRGQKRSSIPGSSASVTTLNGPDSVLICHPSLFYY